MMKAFWFFAALPLLAAAPAHAVSFVTDSVTYTGVGSTQGTTYDEVALGGIGSTILASTTQVLVNTIQFTAGNTGTGSAGVHVGSFANSGTYDGMSFNYLVDYTLTVGTMFDTLVIGGNSFDVGGYTLTLNSQTISSSDGHGATGNLYASIAAVPEPASWAMMVGGFGLIGGAMRRRRPSMRVSFT